MCPSHSALPDTRFLAVIALWQHLARWNHLLLTHRDDFIAEVYATLADGSMCVLRCGALVAATLSHAFCAPHQGSLRQSLHSLE